MLRRFFSRRQIFLFPLIAFILCMAFAAVAFIAVEGSDWNNLHDHASAITIDEFSHISMAFYYLDTGTYFLNPEHPPLVKDIAMLGGLFIHPVIPAFTKDQINEALLKSYPPKTYTFPRIKELSNDQLTWGRLFLLHPGNDPDEIAFWTRLPIIIANAFFFFLLTIFLARVWSKRTALIGLVLLLVSPLTIIHSALVTMDIPASVLQMITLVLSASYFQAILKKNHEWRWFAAVAIFFSLALLSKFSALLLFPVIGLGGFIFFLTQSPSWKTFRLFLAHSILLFFVIFCIVSGVYAIHIQAMSADDIATQLTSSYPVGFPAVGLSFMQSLNTNALTRPIAEYANGVTNVFNQIDSAPQKIYFMGNVYGSEGAGPTYFPMLYATKLPEGLLFLNILALIITLIVFFSRNTDSLWQRLQKWSANPLSLLLIVFCYAYAITTLSSTFQIGIRHILPLIFGITLLTAKGIDRAWDWKLYQFPLIKILTLTSLTFIVVFTIQTFPTYLSAYNSFGGDTQNGYQIATDSNYDWGQDSNKLADWVKQHNITTLYVDLFSSIPEEYYLGKVNQGYSILSGELPPSGSYLAVSIDRYMTNSFNPHLPATKKYTQLSKNIVDRVGTTILIFKIP
ncbi:MAG: glycosyltransferase family 39 protein [Candidatus Moraniibacteriota bacterium]